MKKIFSLVFSLSCVTISAAMAIASTPASQEWVLNQLTSPLLTAADWAAACTSGSPANSGGCYGNVSSSAFTKVSDHLGGFTRYANINPLNVASSVFIKAFFAGTNTPVNDSYITLSVTDSAARCALYTQVGLGLGLGGVSTTNPASGHTSGSLVILHTASLIAINNATVTTDGVYYNAESIGTGVTPLSNVVIPNPIYLLCVGYSPADGSTPTAINVAAT